MDRKPKGFGAFAALLRRLAAVPKEAVDARIAQQQAARREQREKK